MEELKELYLRIYGDPVLREKSKPVTEFGEALAPTIQRMFEVMYEEEGVGLAAPQVGVNVRMMVLDVPMDEGDSFRKVLINPEIQETEGTQKGEEGCLSFPGLRETITRHARIKVRALDERGETLEFEADDLLSRAIQHEIDHLDGVLFIDRMSPVRRTLLGKRLKKIMAEQGARVN